MKRHLTGAIALLTIPLAALAQVQAVETNFATGIPEGFQLINYDGMGFNADHFSKSFAVQDEWFAGDLVPDEGNVAVKGVISNSHRNFEEPTDNWLVLPQLAVEPGTVLSWDAKSMSHAVRESYSVMISTTDTEKASFTTLLDVPEEGYFFQHRFIDLSEYAGQNVYIAFVHNSTHKFLLGLTNLYAGVPVKAKLSAVNTGRHFFDCNDAQPSVDFTVSNHGAEVSLTGFRIRNFDGEIIASVDLPMTLAPGQSEEVSIPITLGINEGIEYEVLAQLEPSGKTTLFTDLASRSEFRRRLLVEKFTGTWCNACPKVYTPTQYALEKLGEEALFVEIHHTGGQGYDEFGCDEFFSVPSSVYYKVAGDFPTLIFNRSHMHNSLHVTSTEAYASGCFEPCQAAVSVKAAFDKSGENILVNSTAEFLDALDNSGDNYRIAYTLVEEEVAPVFGVHKQQLNNCTGYGTYYGMAHYTPGIINNAMNRYHNLVVYGRNSWGGTPESLPAAIEGATEYTHTATIPVPANVGDRSRLRVVCTIVDLTTPTYAVFNADDAKVQEYSGVGDLVDPAQGAPVNVYNLQGTLLLRDAAPEQLQALPAGIYLAGGKKFIVK